MPKRGNATAKKQKVSKKKASNWQIKNSSLQTVLYAVANGPFTLQRKSTAVKVPR